MESAKIIRVRCGDCGPVEVSSREMRMRLCVDNGVTTYLFRCPDCQLVTVEAAATEVVDILLAAGVSVTEWHLPAELEERREGAPISHDDLLEFHEMLESGSWEDAISPSKDG